LAAILVVAVVGVALVGLNNGNAEQDGSNGSDDDSNAEASNNADSLSATIVLGTETTVNGSAITTDADQSVYQSTSSDGFTIINIIDAGTYTISGTADDTQVLVAAGDGDEVVLVLSGVDITCVDAPAIMIASAYDPETAGEAGVTIDLADGTTNIINGSHVGDNDAALSANVSILIEGGGSLKIVADMEGIETFMHLTINGGALTITSEEDAINANNDGVGVITINGGTIYADSSSGSDGDGIDSNGYIVINDGTVYAFSSGGNTGIDSDLGTTINGGLVFATGRMANEVSASSGQPYISLSFSGALSKNTLVYIVDSEGDCVAAFKSLGSYQTLLFSSSELSSGETYKIYVGGAVSGTFDAYGLCTSCTVVTAGSLQTSTLLT